MQCCNPYWLSLFSSPGKADRIEEIDPKRMIKTPESQIDPMVNSLLRNINPVKDTNKMHLEYDLMLSHTSRSEGETFTLNIMSNLVQKLERISKRKSNLPRKGVLRTL
ncbi:hypothetical protein scyTo_0001410 [Scyliorhinus torazame]|uniref:Uncharacterized protein n=1 Tax=Scyliorhinus torazame TaxID=75743 RepID=A0A401PCT4_SCYTO|nr:hypothetical protein [Scyliorhinus torazame]